MRERGCYSTTTPAQPRRPCRPRHPYAVPRTLFQCVCTRRRNCIGQLSPFWKYAPTASRFKRDQGCFVPTRERGGEEQRPAESRCRAPVNFALTESAELPKLEGRRPCS